MIATNAIYKVKLSVQESSGKWRQHTVLIAPDYTEAPVAAAYQAAQEQLLGRYPPGGYLDCKRVSCHKYERSTGRWVQVYLT